MKGALLTYALTVIGVIGGVVSPFVGVLVYVCFAIVRPEFLWFWSFSPGETRFSRMVGMAMLVGWGLQLFGSWNFRKATPVVLCVMGYWGWMLVSSFQAIDQTKSLELIEFFAKVFLPFLVGITTINTMKQVKTLLWTILLCQGYVAFELNLLYYGGSLANFIEDGWGGMDNNCVAIAMVTGLGLAFFLGLGAEKWWQKGIAFGCAALMGHVVLFSFSRGGMLSMALTGCMAFALIPKKPAHYVGFVLAVLLAIRLSGPEVRERFATAFFQSESGVREASAQSRIDLWRGALDTALGNPLFGVGPDNWGLVAPEYGFKKGKEVHSLWMQNAAEVGFPGVLLLFAIFAVCIVKLWPVAKGKVPLSDPFQEDAARMVIASLFGFIVAAQFVTIKYLETPFYIALAGAAILKLLPSGSVQPRLLSASPRVRSWYGVRRQGATNVRG